VDAALAAVAPDVKVEPSLETALGLQDQRLARRLEAGEAA
jgi:hypothetical protein